LRLLAVLQELELVEIAARHILGILQGDDVGARKGLVVEQVLPHLGLDVHALDRVPRKDVGVAAVADGDDVRVVGENLVGDGVDEVALTVAEAGAERVGFCIAREDEADKVAFL
jgi:endonuclease YncB( thermonuclease family)